MISTPNSTKSCLQVALNSAPVYGVKVPSPHNTIPQRVTSHTPPKFKVTVVSVEGSPEVILRR